MCSEDAGGLCGVVEGYVLPCSGGSVVAGICSWGGDPCCAAEGSLRPCSSGRAFPLSSPRRWVDSVPLDGLWGSYGSVSLGVCIRLDAISEIAGGEGDGLSCSVGMRSRIHHFGLTLGYIRRF